MAGRVFVTGASGFVGSAIVDELTSRGFAVNALVNRRSLPDHPEVTVIKGDLFDPVALDRGMQGCSAVIHLVGIIMEKRSQGLTFERMHFEGTQAVVDAAKRNGIKRYAHMSALGTRFGAVSDYHKTKFRAEEYVRASGLDWTIFRPSLIHGPGGEFMQMEAKWARFKAPPFLFMPYFGRGLFGFGGAGKLQPVFVNDVARAFVDALENRRTIGEVYPIAGPDVVTWPQLHTNVSHEVVHHKRWIMPMPVWVARILASILPARLLGFNRDQLIMSQEDNTTDLTKFVDHFGWQPQPFGSSLSQYADQL
ncbi:MAG TPA: NAD(P)H-binding protein [Tepidisphaeraceae bacterium]|jgi:NADH dehydrogenase|nr:NAD(P)H-binding protein [Tepidisphaeraceae bacterium]